MIDDLARDETDLRSKIDRKEEELKRVQKRMKALKNVRYVILANSPVTCHAHCIVL